MNLIYAESERLKLIILSADALGKVVGMPSIGNILRITQCQQIFGETACNVFYYLVAAWTGNLDLDDVIDEFIDAVATPLQPLQSAAVSTIQIRVDNVSTGLEFAERTNGLLSGTATGEAAPSYMAAGFRLNRTTGVTRNGAKRFTGVTEGHISGQTWSPYDDAPAIAMANALAADLILDVNDELSPVIVGRQANGSLDLTKLNPVASATPLQYLTTQNSRKIEN